MEDNQIIENGIQNGERQKDAAQNVLKILIEKDFVCLDRKDAPTIRTLFRIRQENVIRQIGFNNN